MFRWYLLALLALAASFIPLALGFGVSRSGNDIVVDNSEAGLVFTGKPVYHLCFLAVLTDHVTTSRCDDR
jgi:hypothetical protein